MKKLRISSEESDGFQYGLAPYIGADAYDETILCQIREAALKNCPRDLKAHLEYSRDSLEKSGAILVTWPAELTQKLPRKVSMSAHRSRVNLLPELVELGVAFALGEPVAYHAEKDGALVQHVYPVRSEQSAPSNESSQATLGLHTELVYSSRHPIRPMHIDSPDFVLLFCLRSDPKREAATMIADISVLSAKLSRNHLSVLRQPRFELQAPYSFSHGLQIDRPWIGPVPILFETDGQLTAAFDLACGTRGIDTEANNALESLRDAAALPGVTQQYALQAGDMLILDNRRCAHGRTSFEALYDESDRWILRLYVRRSLEGMRPWDPDLSPRVF